MNATCLCVLSTPDHEEIRCAICKGPTIRPAENTYPTVFPKPEHFICRICMHAFGRPEVVSIHTDSHAYDFESWSKLSEDERAAAKSIDKLMGAKHLAIEAPIDIRLIGKLIAVEIPIRVPKQPTDAARKETAKRAIAMYEFIGVVRAHKSFDTAVERLRTLLKLDRPSAVKLLYWTDNYSTERKLDRIYPVPCDLVRGWPNSTDILLVGMGVDSDVLTRAEAERAVLGSDEVTNPLRYTCADCGAMCPDQFPGVDWKPAPAENPPAKLKDRLVLRLCCPDCSHKATERILRVAEEAAEHKPDCRCSRCDNTAKLVADYMGLWYFASVKGKYPHKVLHELARWLYRSGRTPTTAHIGLRSDDHVLVYFPDEGTARCVMCGADSGQKWVEWDDYDVLPAGWTTAMWGGPLPDKLETLPLDFLVCPKCGASLTDDEEDHAQGEAEVQP